MSDTLTGAPAANFIAGQWVPSHSGSVYERRNPWRPRETLGEFPSSDGDDVAAAVAAAADGAPRLGPPAGGRPGGVPERGRRRHRGSCASRSRTT